MYVEALPSGQFKYVERYKDPMTLKWKRVSVTLDKNDRKTKKLAEERLKEKIDAAMTMSDVSFLTFSELVDKYLAYQAKNVRQSTYKRNALCANFFLDTFGKDTLVRNLNARYIRECLDKSGRANSTKNEFLKRLKALLRWGYQNDYIESVEFLNKLAPYKDDTRKMKLEDKYLEQDEIKKLLTSMKKSGCTTWVNMTEFLILSGLRVGEAIALEKSDLSDEYISVTKTYDKLNRIINNAPKTDMSNREVYIQDELRQVINRIQTHNRIRKISGKFLFCDDDGKHVEYDNFRIFLRRHSKKSIGRIITPHALRHTHASLLIAKGIDIEAVSRRLGHANSKVTREIYVHIMEELKQNDNKQLQKLKLM